MYVVHPSDVHSERKVPSNSNAGIWLRYICCGWSIFEQPKRTMSNLVKSRREVPKKVIGPPHWFACQQLNAQGAKVFKGNGWKVLKRPSLLGCRPSLLG